ncbi:MAG: DUF1330 domain-containing protein [Paracoccaceae bacterium]
MYLIFDANQSDTRTSLNEIAFVLCRANVKQRLYEFISAEISIGSPYWAKGVVLTATVVAFLSINEDQPLALSEYFRVTTPLLERAGAEIVSRFTLGTPVVGASPPQTVVIVKYPSLEAVESVFSSPDYESIKPMRDVAFSRYEVTIAVEGSDGQEARVILS